MGAGSIVLMGVRVLVVIVALAVVGLGIWAKIIVHDVEVRGSSILDTLNLQPPSREESWQSFFNVLIDGTIKIWIAIAAGAYTLLSSTIILFSAKVDRLKISPYLLLPMELLSLLAMAGGFGVILSLTLRISAFTDADLDPSGSADLTAFNMLRPLIRGYAIATGSGLFVLLVTTLSSIVEVCNRARAKKQCSFEPTASALGMGHGYQAVQPPEARATIPTLYDPLKPVPGTAVTLPNAVRDDEKGFALEGADMGVGRDLERRDSGLSSMSGKGKRDEEEGISGPLGLERPGVGAQIRPARPWSEAPKRKGT